MPFNTSQHIDRFLFRDLHPKVFMGTASDRYAGWIGQIYSQKFADKITKRSNTVGGKSFTEEVLPVESVEEYFEHFRVLELDYTFYSLLLNPDGKPTKTYHVLQSYAQHIPAGNFVILKVPQVIFAHKLFRGGKHIENKDYLNQEIFTRQFYKPAIEILGDTLRGLVFEQEYQRKNERVPVDEMAKSLDSFFQGIPKDDRYHIELRTESLLAEPVLRVLEKYGIGQVLSHWTWLPPLHRQFTMAGSRFLNSGGDCIFRLMTPIGMRYEDAYAKAHPFNAIVEGMLNPRMVEDTAGLMITAIDQGVSANIIINNRAGGNAPRIAQEVAKRFVETERGAGKS